MVWASNFIVNDKMFSTQRFLNVFFSFSIYEITLLLFNFPLLYTKEPTDIFKIGKHLEPKHFPQNFFFANFQCLRCGLCCKKYESAEVTDKAALLKWKKDSRDDILKYLTVHFDGPEGYFHAELDKAGKGCPMHRKIVNKPYCGCQIHMEKEYLPICDSYICSKSLPIANLPFDNVDELIEKIGLKRYKELISKCWENDFA